MIRFARLAFAAALLPWAAAAAPTATIQNTDEPGRNPYQEVAFAREKNKGLIFSTVPPGQRRIITHINCQWALDQVADDQVFTFYANNGLPNNPPYRFVLHLISDSNYSPAAGYFGDAEVFLAADPGAQPAVVPPRSARLAGFLYGECTATGYIIRL